MISTDAIHKKFKGYWPDYQNKDIMQVCKAILKEMGRPIKNPLEAVKREWGAVCKFLHDWEGELVKVDKTKPAVRVTPEQKLIFEGKVCPYCKKPTEYIKDSSVVFSRDFGPLYICRPCQSWCGVHRDEPTKSLGRIANAELRELKKEAHAAFDPIWKSNYKNRHDAYTWLSKQLGTPRNYTHIGMFNVETCKRVIELCQKELA